jgi:hypothetical protein
MKMINKMKYTLLVCLAVLGSSCEISEIDDPNNPQRDPIEENATIGELNNLVAGTESLLRDEMGFYYDAVSIIGREYYFFTDADPRYTGELVGKGASVLDNAGFYGTRPYAGRYRVILNANILINAVTNTTAALTDEERNGYLGFAKTLQAYSYLLVLNLQNSNGIRIDVSDPDNLGPFLSYTESLTAISDLLDEAYDHLTSDGSAVFKFTLSSGFKVLDDEALTPDSDDFGLQHEEFAEFNRAIKARVELYRGNKTAALSALTDSFMDQGGDLDFGAYHYYSTAGNDIPNPVFRTPGQAEALIVQQAFISDAQLGDDRVSAKTQDRGADYTFDGLTGRYDVIIYSSLNSPIPIIRNEELILIYAEANIGTDNNEAINALNILRNAHNLADYGGATDDASVLDELLYNRRYSLFGEGHRWVDMRRYDRLDELPNDRVDDNVWVEMPRPVSEVGVQGG